MSAYVLFRSEDIRAGDELRRYVSEVDETLDRHGGQILVQSFPARVLEGQWEGFVTLLRFPDVAAAERWYASVDYQAIRGLRIASSTPTGLVLDGVAEGHRSCDLLSLLAS